MNFCCFKRFLQVKWRKNRRKTFRQHGFTSTGWANKDNIVPTGSCDLECTFDIFLTFYIGKIIFKITLRLQEFITCIYTYRLQTLGIASEKFNHFSYM